MALEELIDQLGRYPEMPTAVAWRDQMRAARDVLVKG